MAATIKDVARLAEVAVGTVSRYLNGYKVTAANRLRIESAVKALDFKINPIARSLKTNKSMTVAVIVPALANIFSMNIIESIERHLDRFGYSVMVCDSQYGLAKERAKLEFVKEKYADGVVLMPICDRGSHIAGALGPEIPVVLVDRLVDDFVTDAVVIDNINAVYQAVEELIVRGHRRIGMIAGPQGIFTARERLEGYRRVLKDYGIAEDARLILYGDYLTVTGYQQMQRLLLQERRPTAVIVSNYEMTLGAVTCLNDQGVAIPEDLSVVGFDQLELSGLVKPALSVIVQPKEEIGLEAAKILVRRMNGDKSGPPTIVRLKARFLRRDSIRDLNTP